MRQISILVLMLCSIIFGQASTEGLVAWFPLNGSAVDGSGQGNNGTLHGGKCVGDYNGNPGLAIQFTNSNSYITLQPSTLDTQFTAITIAAWVAPGYFPAYVLSKQHQSCSIEDIGLYLDVDSLHLTLSGHHFSFYNETNYYQSGWNHVAATWDGDSIRVYADGNLLGSAEFTGGLSWNSQSIYLANNVSGESQKNISLDEVRIYNRALNETEIMALHDYVDTVKLIKLLSPVGGEKYLARQKQDITWISNQIGNISIEYSTNSGSDWQSISSSVSAGPGKYQWSIPQNLSTTCKVRIRDTGDSTFTATSDSTFSIIDTVAYLNITALLEGFYHTDSGKMTPDYVYVSLHPASNPDSIVDYRSTYLDSLGHGMAAFLYTTDSLCYVVINHRNHVETWSAATYRISRDTTLTLDFTTARSMAYHSNMVLQDNKACIYGGDVNQDGCVDPLDVSLIDFASCSYASGYVPEDINGDGYVDPLDLSIAGQNSYSYVSVKRPPARLGKIVVKRKWDFHNAQKTNIPVVK
jgi:hypothetical protein